MLKQMQRESQSCLRFEKKVHKDKQTVIRVILAAVIIVMFAITMVIPDALVHAETIGDEWFDASRGVTLYSKNDSGTGSMPDNVGKEQTGYISKQIAEFLRNLGDGITELLQTDTVDFSLDGVVLGRLASSTKGVASAQFELASGNPWGIVGAYLYVTLRSIAYGLFVIMFLFILFPQAIKGDGKSISEMKSLIGNTVIMFALLFFFPYIVDWLLYLRDAAISVILNLMSSVFGGGSSGTANGILDFFRESAAGQSTDVPYTKYEWAAMLVAKYGQQFGSISNVIDMIKAGSINPMNYADIPTTHTVEVVNLGSCVVYVIACCLGIVWLSSYLATAVIQTGLFGLFPLFAILSLKDNRQTLKHFSGVFFINMLIPLVDSFLLMLPVIIRNILTGGNKGAKDFGLFLMQLILLWGIMPARMIILRGFGRAFGIDASTNGIRGLIGLGMAIGGAAMNAGRRITSGGNNKERSKSSDGLTAKEKIADAERGSAVMESASRDAKMQLADVKAIMGDDYGKTGTLGVSGGGTSASAMSGSRADSGAESGTANPLFGAGGESAIADGPKSGEDDIHAGMGSISSGGRDADEDILHADYSQNNFDKQRADNLDLMDRMQEEIDANNRELSGINVTGLEREVDGMESEARALEKQNGYLEKQISDSMMREQDDMRQNGGSPQGSMEYMNQQAWQREIDNNNARIEQLRGHEVRTPDGETIRVGGQINAKMSEIAKAQNLQARNTELRNGVDRSRRIEQNLAAASGAAGMSSQIYHSKAEMQAHRAMDTNRAKMANYKNYMSNDFSQIITPEQRAMFAKQQYRREQVAKGAHIAGGVAKVAVGAGVAAAAVPMSMALGPDGMQVGAYVAGGAGAIAGRTVEESINHGYVAGEAVKSRVASYAASHSSSGHTSQTNGLPITNGSETNRMHGSNWNNQQQEVSRFTDQADKKFGANAS